MDVPSQHSRLSRIKNIEDYSNSQEILSDVESLKNANLNLLLKTEVLERYLRKRCPALLVAMDRCTERSMSIRSTLVSVSTTTLPLLKPSLTPSLAVSEYSPSHSSATSNVAHSRSLPHSSVLSAQRISPSIMMDMVDRELDESRITMDKLQRRFESTKFLLETEEENTRADLKMLEESKVALENFIKHNMDKKTGRVFHDKFVRFIETDLQNVDRNLRKMKLKVKSTQIEYNRLLARQEQRLELRERTHPIDINKLNIENAELLEKLEHKTRTALELKKAVGKKGQTLVVMKSKLNDVMLLLRNLRQDIKQKEQKYKFVEEKEIKNVNELITAEIINDNMKRLNSTYKSPDAHNYLQVQVRLQDLKTERETWTRRLSYQRQTIMMLEHQVKQNSPRSTRSKKSATCTSRSRSLRSAFSSKSADSLLRRFTRGSPPHCTPTTPSVRHW